MEVADTARLERARSNSNHSECCAGNARFGLLALNARLIVSLWPCTSDLKISKKTEVLADISRSKDANATLQTAIRIHMFREQKFIHRLQHITVFLQLPLQIHTGVGGGWPSILFPTKNVSAP